MRRWLTLAALPVIVLATAANALAGTARVGPSAVSYRAAAGEVNHVIIAKDPVGVRVLDSGAPIVAGDNCTSVTANEVVCNSSPSPNMVVTLGDQNDFGLLAGGFVHVAVYGQAGNDRLNGSEDNDLLVGGEGVDTLSGGLGRDRLRGGGGDDVLRGGFNHDVADYAERSGAVEADLDGVSDDGEDGEADRLISIEGLVGGRAGDVLTGNARANILRGGAGEDTLRAQGGSDRASGGPGDDRIWGGRGRDRLEGGEGDDRLVGAQGRDGFFGDAGRDLLLARDGRADTPLIGGPGHDAAMIDPRLDHPRSIERLL